MTTRERLAIHREVEQRNRARMAEYRAKERLQRFRPSSAAACAFGACMAKIAVVFFGVLLLGAVALLA